MSAGWCLRTTRAAVFAAVCVLLAALGHVTMSGHSVPWWSLVVALVVCAGAAWCLAGRERGLFPVSFAVVAAQTALHAWFSYAQAPSMPSMHTGGTADGMTDGHHSAFTAHTGQAIHSMPHGETAMDATDAMDQATGIGHMMSGGMSSTGMLAAHLLAAVLCGLWLAQGESAVFKAVRACADRAFVPLRLVLAVLCPPPAPPSLRPAPRPRRRLRQFLLVHALTTRGPPGETAVA
ncbi:hypothetical protein ACGFZZ_11025 [Streptomyces tendae]|uniref:hypothetical protein n=1 Tax=Streptomyces tendae TaxID=1932 RepID=UPI0034076C46